MLFMPAPLCFFPPSLHLVCRLSAAVGHEGYSVESQCYYKSVGGENWDNFLVMESNCRVLPGNDMAEKYESYYVFSLRIVILV